VLDTGDARGARGSGGDHAVRIGGGVIPPLLIHVLAGGAAIVLGYVALCVAKGGRVHRRSGMLFVYAMLTMTILGGALAFARSAAPGLNVPAALLTAYLVLTGLLAIKPAPRGVRAIATGLLFMVVGVTAICLTFGYEAVAAGGTRKGMPAFPFLMFATVGAFAVVGDVRVLRSGMPQGTARLRRHLWRMCFALFIAAMSFFIGQADEFPAYMRIMPLLAIPAFLPLLFMTYWLWRVRVRRPAGAATTVVPRPTVAGTS
jgi:uncharacterized membrane protein